MSIFKNNVTNEQKCHNITKTSPFLFRRHCAVTILRAWGFGKTVAARSRRNEHSNSG